MSALSFDEHYTKGEFAPFLRERRLAGTSPALLFDLAQPRGEFSDPPLSDLLICVARSSHRVTTRTGDARFAGRVSPGQYVVIPPHCPSTTFIDDRNAFRVVSVPEHRARLIVEELRPTSDPFDFDALQTPSPRNDFVQQMVHRIWDDAADVGQQSSLYADAALVILLGELAANVQQKPVLEPAKGGLAPWQLRRLSDYLQDHLTEDVSLADLSQLIGLSTHHLCRAFKQSTGLPPHRWRVARRIERAREMLENTDLPVTEISALVGYDDPTLLARAFRKALGVSPTQYRRERRS